MANMGIIPTLMPSYEPALMPTPALTVFVLYYDDENRKIVEIGKCTIVFVVLVTFLLGFKFAHGEILYLM